MNGSPKPRDSSHVTVVVCPSHSQLCSVTVGFLSRDLSEGDAGISSHFSQHPAAVTWWELWPHSLCRAQHPQKQQILSLAAPAWASTPFTGAKGDRAGGHKAGNWAADNLHTTHRRHPAANSGKTKRVLLLPPAASTSRAGAVLNISSPLL